MRLDGGRILLGDNRRQDSHAAADQVTMYLSLHLHWTGRPYVF